MFRRQLWLTRSSRRSTVDDHAIIFERPFLTPCGRSLLFLAPLSEATGIGGVIFGILGGLESKRVSLMRLACVGSVQPGLRGLASRSRSGSALQLQCVL